MENAERTLGIAAWQYNQSLIHQAAAQGDAKAQ